MINAVGRDFTAERERADALAAAEEALRQSQKMEAVGQLTGGLAHDFNNLLAGISGSLELIQTRLAQGRLMDVDRYISAAQGASKRAAALTHRLLAFSRRQTLDPKPTDVNRLVAGMEDLIRRTVGPAVTGRGRRPPPDLWPALVDPPQLENALLNLCINARDAMPEGGRITIETANAWLDARAARRHDMPPGQYLLLRVDRYRHRHAARDRRQGVRAVLHHQADGPGHRPRPVDDLRLRPAIGRPGADRLRGRPRHRLSASTCPATGAPWPRRTRTPHSARRPRAAPGETVLVVDDEPTVRMLVTEVLEDLGYTAIEAADSVAGLKVLQSDVRIDLLVTRCRAAGRPERAADGRGRPGHASGPEGAVHHRLRRARRAGQWPARPRHAGDHQAVRVEVLGARIREMIGTA